MSKKSPQLRFEGFTDDWEQRKLKDIVNRVTRKNKNLESTLPLTISAQYGLVDQITFFNKQIASKDMSGYYLLQKGEFAYNKSYSKDFPWGAIKRLNMYDEGVLSTLYIAFLPFKVNSDFLVSYYETDGWHKEVAIRAAEGARNHGLLNITAVDFFDTGLMIPPNNDEQQEIGGFFIELDHTITLHQRKLDLLKEQKKGFLQKMFPKNGAKVPELRFAGFADDWEERKLSSGLREYTDRVIVEDDKEYYQISVRNNFGGITLRGSKMGNKIGRKRQAKINLTKYPQTLIFTRQTVEQGGIGWVDKYCDGAIVTENMPTISLDTSVFSKYFLTNLFQTRIFYKNAILDNVEGGSAQIAIHESKFLSSTLLFPNLDEQEKIGQFFKQLDNTITLHQLKLDLLKEQKKGFLQKMFV